MAKLLLVEDDPLMSRMYEKIFTFEKHSVTLAEDGEKGLEMAKENKPDLILLDVMMPKMNGLDMLKKLKENDDTKAIPVIMLTNLAGEKDAESALSLGAVKYIIKSDQTPSDVAKMVKEILAGYTRDDVPKAA